MFEHFFGCQNNGRVFLFNRARSCLSLVFSSSTASHISFTDDLVTIWNKHWINFPTVRYIKIASPFPTITHKGLNIWAEWSPKTHPKIPALKWSTAVAHQTQLFFEPIKVSNSSSSPTRGNCVGFVSLW